MVGILSGYLDDASRMVKTESTHVLASLAEHDAALRARVIASLETLTQTGSPAMQSEGRKLLRCLGR